MKTDIIIEGVLSHKSCLENLWSELTDKQRQSMVKQSVSFVEGLLTVWSSSVTESLQELDYKADVAMLLLSSSPDEMVPILHLCYGLDSDTLWQSVWSLKVQGKELNDKFNMYQDYYNNLK